MTNRRDCRALNDDNEPGTTGRQAFVPFHFRQLDQRQQRIGARRFSIVNFAANPPEKFIAIFLGDEKISLVYATVFDWHFTVHWLDWLLHRL